MVSRWVVLEIICAVKVCNIRGCLWCQGAIFIKLCNFTIEQLCGLLVADNSEYSV